MSTDISLLLCGARSVMSLSRGSSFLHLELLLTFFKEEEQEEV